MNPPENSPPLKLPTVFHSSSPEKTQSLGENLAYHLSKGSIVALKGPLGAGKTCLIKGIARKLAVTEVITSPTYTIISEYEGLLRGKKITIFHIDAYRLGGNDDFSAIGGEEIVFGNGISLIEWSERIPAFVPANAIKVEIEIKKDSERIIRIYREENV